ncbi:MAG TPA: hypothetical protein PK280_18605 [Planctomycetota bacterium]|nr:hypothetical protein [Planctomycetota bacterium]
MTEPADQPAKPLRTWRPMAAWTAAILLALGLAWFVGAVVVPVWQVNNAVNDLERSQPAKVHYLGLASAIEGRLLDNPREAARKTRLYIRLLRPSGDRESAAYLLLQICDGRSVVAALDGITDSNPLIRLASVEGLRDCELGNRITEVIAALELAATDRHEDVRSAADYSLQTVRAKAAGK